MAGTRNLPIVYIDDKVAGDTDRCVALEKSGELDKMLNYSENKNMSLFHNFDCDCD
jgi:hypothetical protein